METKEMKLVVAITGASGAIYSFNLLKILKSKEIETFLIISKPADKIISHELKINKNELIKYATKYYDVNDLSAPISSGSHSFDAMVVIPCSMNTVSAIANGNSNNLIRRVADIALKENRKLILVPREAPLNAIHLENLLKLARLNVTIIPACPAFYHNPKEIDDIVNFIVGRVLSQLQIQHKLHEAWKYSKS